MIEMASSLASSSMSPCFVLLVVLLLLVLLRLRVVALDVCLVCGAFAHLLHGRQYDKQCPQYE